MTYVDYNGNERTEDFYFNLNKAELTRMEMSINGGLAERINRIVAAQDTPAIIEVFEDLIQKSYGIKTLDGRGFVKKKEDLEAFMATEAYSDLFMELATDSAKASEFINGVIPANLAKQLEAAK
jgi:hypothetical protein